MMRLYICLPRATASPVRFVIVLQFQTRCTLQAQKRGGVRIATQEWPSASKWQVAKRDWLWKTPACRQAC